MKIVVHNPTAGIYTATADYVHAVEVREPSRILFVSGTMGLDERGVAGKSLEQQLELGPFSFDDNGDTTMAVMSGNIVENGKFRFVTRLGNE